MQTEKFQLEGKIIMQEKRFTEFPASFVDPRVGISRFALETDVWLLFLPMKLRHFYLLSVNFFISDILRRRTTFSERHSRFFMVVQKWRHFWNLVFWRHF